MDFNSVQEFQEQKYDLPYHYKDIIAKGYKPLRSLEYTSKLKLIKQIILSRSITTLLDAGCGDGRFCYEMSDPSMMIAGVDYSERALSFARAFNHGTDIQFYCQDLRSLNIAGSFQCIVLLDVLEHLPPADIPSVLHGIACHMNEDSILIVFVPSINQSLTPKHYQHFNSETLQTTLLPYFKLADIKGFYPLRIKFIVKLLQGVIGNAYPLLDKVGLYHYLHRFASDYFMNHAITVDPDKCKSILGIFTKKNE